MTHHQDTVRNALSGDDARLHDALGRRQNPLQVAPLAASRADAA